MEYEGARIQLLDLPGIVEGASQGRGRGRQVVATAKTADLILIMLDATKSEEQRRLLEIELDAVGIRLNKQRPDVVFKRKTTGGVRIVISGCVNSTHLYALDILLQITVRIVTRAVGDFIHSNSDQPDSVTHQDGRKDHPVNSCELYVEPRVSHCIRLIFYPKTNCTTAMS